MSIYKSKNYALRAIGMIASFVLVLTSTMSHAASGTWLGNDGNWGDAGTWSGGTMADGIDSAANFTGVNITASRTITLEADRTIGNITFTDATTSSHDLTISGANILTLDVTTAPPIIDVTQAGRTLTISSVISGADGLQKNGLGILTLSGVNNYSGQTYITGGTLRLANTAAVAGSSQVTMKTAAGSLVLGTDTAFTAFPTVSCSSTGGPYTLVSDRATAGAGLTHTLALISAGNNTFNFTKGSYVTSGTAGLSFTGINLSGGSAGTVILNPTTASLTVGSVNGNAYAKTLTLDGTSTGNTITGTIADGAAAVTLTKIGSGTWTLSGANTYSGNTVIGAGQNGVNYGVLDVGDVSTGGLSANSFLQFNTWQNGAGYYFLQGYGLFNRTVNGAGGSGWGAVATRGSIGFSARGGKLTINTTAIAMSSSFYSYIVFNSASSDSELEWQSNIDLSNGSRTIRVYAGVNANSFATISGIISHAGGSLTKDGSGKLVLKGDNSYGGSTTVSVGILNIQHNNGLGSTGGGVSVTSGAALELQGGRTIGAEALALNGTGISSGGALRNISGDNSYAGLITLGSAVLINSDSGTLTLDVASGDAITGVFNLTFGGAGNITVADPITTGTGTLTKDGAGMLTLSGVNTFSGNTTVNAGTLSLAGGSALADSTTLYVASSAKINLAANETVDKLYINGLEAQAGTWGSSASGAMNQWDDYFTGTGILTVSTGSGITRPASPKGTMFLVH